MKTISDKREKVIGRVGVNNWVYPERHIKRLITEIQVKVVMNWKGKDDFVNWLNERVGDRLAK